MLLVFGRGVHGQAPVGAPEWPAITREAKPWTRWWWHGSAVTEQELTTALAAYERVGLGGVEITPIYGVWGHEEKFIEYLSPLWVDRLTYTLSEADRIGLGVDLATGTGWPFGGPWVTAEDAPKYVAHRSHRLRAGERLTEPVTYRQEPLVRAVGNQIYETYGIYRNPREPAQGTRERPPERPGSRRIDISELVEPVSANANLQMLALDQVRFPKPLPLQILMAYSDTGVVLDLTRRVDVNGRLDWVAPAGDWTLYAIFQGWHGKMVERAAPGGEGNVIDHFSGEALSRYLERFDRAFAARDISTVRAFFNDSYEVDDAAGEADWTPALFEEFESRRGYDLRGHLPALFGNDAEESNARVLSDYRETISDLILEKFTRPWHEWAGSKGALVRNQAHGSPANILDLYAASDIPETEGTEILRFKFATSAANVTGKRLAASESATWLGEHFTSSLADVKHALDKFLLSGVNHIFYHGTAYSPGDETWPGWLFYAAVHFTPANPWWTDFGTLNQYVARSQSFLQAGTPDNDVLLYFPVYDRFATRGEGMLEHFDGTPGADPSAFRTAAETMLARGYAFDFISDRQLQKVEFAEGSLHSSRARYRTVVLPEARYVPVATMEKLLALARGGAMIVVYGELPGSVPGLGDLDARTARFRQLLESLQFEPARDSRVREARVGSGSFLIGDDLSLLLSHARVRRESIVDRGVQFVRRSIGNGTTYFLVNQGGAPVDGWVPLEVSARSAALFDPMSERSGYARIRPAGEGKTEVYLQIQPSESRIVRTLDSAVDGQRWSYFRTAAEPEEIRGVWSIEFEEGGPELPPAVRTRELGSWTELGGDAVRSFSGTATYKVKFRKPRAAHDAWLLDLGRVHESARVILNGQELGTLIGPTFQLTVEAGLLLGENRLEVRVTNLMANRIADLDRQGVFWKKFYNINFPARLAENRGATGLFDAAKWAPRPSGLIGPVTLTPVEVFHP